MRYEVSHNRLSDNHPQSDMLAQMRAESVIPQPERGPNVQAYYRAKHANGRLGRFFPLHQVAVWGKH
jgi:hypothetical protein